MESGNPLPPEVGPGSLLGYTAGRWWGPLCWSAAPSELDSESEGPGLRVPAWPWPGGSFHVVSLSSCPALSGLRTPAPGPAGSPSWLMPEAQEMSGGQGARRARHPWVLVHGEQPGIGLDLLFR